MTFHDKRIVRLVGAFAVLFGLLTLKEGGSVLLGDADAQAAAGHYVPFVVWFNVLAAFAYVAAGAGLWLRRRWAAQLSLGIAVCTAVVFAVFTAHVLLGGQHEMRTFVAMTARALIWTGLAIFARRLPRRDATDTASS